MSSAIVRRGLIEIAKPIGRHIRSGRTTPVWCGTIIGGAIGGMAGLIEWALCGPGVILGALVGACVAAANFKWPPEPPWPAGWMGRVLAEWVYSFTGGAALIVVTERAIFFQIDANGSLQALSDHLKRGAEPPSPECIVIPLDDFRYLELPLGSKTAIVAYERRGKVKRQEIECPSVEDRDALGATVQQALGRPLEEAEEEVPFGRAMLNPITLVCLVIALTVAVAWLAQHWRDFPPRNPVGKNEPDELVSALRFMGPLGVAAIGAVAEIAAIAWLLKRIYSPPRMRVLRLPEADVA
ncbi:MAG TPA: hypothetical protein VGJ26_05300 [Pirellulales bacterium]